MPPFLRPAVQERVIDDDVLAAVISWRFKGASG